MTPAQAYGHPDYVLDVPVQGPTDQGMRELACLFVKTVLPTPQQAACVDCKGPIPMWAKTNTGVSEKISFGGVGAVGFALGAPGDPDAWTQLTPAQQTWVVTSIRTLDSKIREQTKTTCPGMQSPSITGMAGCFQNWFNSAKLGLTKRDGSPVVLRTDGVFDQDTLDALRTVTSLDAKNYPTPFPGTEAAGIQPVKKLSTGAMVGIAAAGATVLGGIAYVAMHGKSKRKGRTTRRKRK
jgi:hypothetical protein